jgi:hypothetical protein
MSVTVTPDAFTLVKFDHDELVGVAEKLLVDLGLADLDLRVDVDESTPLGRAIVSGSDPVTVAVESGALEDPRRPRELSASGSADLLGRLLLRVRDRRDPKFGDPPEDKDLTQGEAVAWDVYCVGRLVRLGYKHHDNRQRRLYHFRNRHGFSDAADAAFERLWTAEGLTWSDIKSLSDSATA